MLSSAVRITEDLPGLEKTLRLFQGLSTIAVGLAQTPQELQTRSRAVSQFAVSASNRHNNRDDAPKSRSTQSLTEMQVVVFSAS
jgi:hypothetical protein